MSKHFTNRFKNNLSLQIPTLSPQLLPSFSRKLNRKEKLTKVRPLPTPHNASRWIKDVDTPFILIVPFEQCQPSELRTSAIQLKGGGNNTILIL